VIRNHVGISPHRTRATAAGSLPCADRFPGLERWDCRARAARDLHRRVRVRPVLSAIGDWNPTEEQGRPDGWDSSRAGAFVAFFVVVTFVAPAVEELTYVAWVFPVAPYGLASQSSSPACFRCSPRARHRPSGSHRVRDRRRLAPRSHRQHLPPAASALDIQWNRPARVR
jgi:hypothetical protein